MFFNLKKISKFKDNMVKCLLCQCDKTIEGHWFLKYNHNRIGFYPKIPILRFFTILFRNSIPFVIQKNDYRGKKFTVICEFECNKSKLENILNLAHHKIIYI